MSTDNLLVLKKMQELETITEKLRFYAEYFEDYAYKANKKINEEYKKDTDTNKDDMKPKDKMERYLKDSEEIQLYSRLTGIGKSEEETCLFDDIQREIKKKLEEKGANNLKITNRVQQGNVTEIPYIALMNNDVCSNPTAEEPYIVIFVSTMLKRIYLGFNIGGVKNGKDNLKKCKAIRSELASNLKSLESKDVLSQLYDEPGNKIKDQFVSEKSSTTSSGYKYTVICYKYYDIADLEILDDNSFMDDLISFISLYDIYASNRDKKTILGIEESKKKHLVISDALNVISKCKQVILYGPPGTGKTRMAKLLALKLINPELSDEDVLDLLDKQRMTDSKQIKLVQFHASYNYDDFIIGLEARAENGNIKYEVKGKVLYEFAEEANGDTDNPYILIIDEINRAPLSSVLGELLYALEYRGQAISIPYAIDKKDEKVEKVEKLRIPKNLYIIGTMNTADRSIAEIDYAIRRRFAFIKVLPETPTDLKGRQYAGELFDKINSIFNDNKNISKGISPDDIRVGTSYFIYEDEGHLKYKLEYEIIPILKEYYKDGILTRRSKCEEFILSEVFDDRGKEEKFIKYLLTEGNDN